MLKVLAIEDDENQLQLLQFKLVDQFEVQTALSLKRGRQLLLTDKFDAILLDVGLPDSDREGLVESVKELANGAAIIILSGYQDADFMTKSIANSASNYLLKGQDDLTGEILGRKIRIGINTSVRCQRLEQKIADVNRTDFPPPPLALMSWLVPVAAIALTLAAAAASYDPDLNHLFAIDRWIELIAKD